MDKCWTFPSIFFCHRTSCTREAVGVAVASPTVFSDKGWLACTSWPFIELSNKHLTPMSVLCHSSPRVFMFVNVRDFLSRIYAIVPTSTFTVADIPRLKNHKPDPLTPYQQLRVASSTWCAMSLDRWPLTHAFDQTWGPPTLRQKSLWLPWSKMRSHINLAWHIPHQGLLLHYLRFCTQIKAAATRVLVIFGLHLHLLPPASPMHFQLPNVPLQHSQTSQWLIVVPDLTTSFHGNIYYIT